MQKTKTVIPICPVLLAASLMLALSGCSTVSEEDRAAAAAREAQAAEQRTAQLAEQREAQAAAEARAAEELRQKIEAHNSAMRKKVAAYKIDKTTWRDVQRDFGPTWHETQISPKVGKIGMLSTVRTATQRFDEPSESTPLIGRIVIGSWKGTKRKGQVHANYARDPQLFDVLVTLDFVNNVLVEKY